jgi:glycosyltransferase involved in cell wall biosynthesis
MPDPLISVIVVCRNPGEKLQTALESVWMQAGDAADLVVVDGASTDGTRDRLQACAHRLGAWASEPDRGVYDAMNKTVHLARGEWLLFLGADDRLAGPHVLSGLAKTLHTTAAGVLSGSARYDDDRLYTPAPDAYAIRRNFLHHQATFYRRSLLSSVQGYDATLRYQADYDLNLRLLMSGAGIERSDTLVAICGRGGLSDAGHWANYQEEISVRHRHFPKLSCWPWDAAACLRWVRKRFRRTPP